jgi:hypothetical protein
MSVHEFQSHNGAIAAKMTDFRQIVGEMFQSHNGAIAAQGKIWGLRAKWDKMREGCSRPSVARRT